MTRTHPRADRPANHTPLEQATLRADQAETRADQAKTRAEAAETRTEHAEQRTDSAKTRTEQAETRAEQAEARVEQAETRAEQAETHAEQAEMRAVQAQTKLELDIYDELDPPEEIPTSRHPQFPTAAAIELGHLIHRLTTRQREVLQLIAQGQNTKQIAGTLQISPKTVEYHRLKLMSGLNVHDIPGLVRLALRAGIIPPDS